MIAADSSTTFLKKVCQFEITRASPKHPQSETGLNKAKYNVKGVMKHMKIRVRSVINFLYTPISIHTPKANSKAERLMERITSNPDNTGKPNDDRYSPIFMAPPVGSTALTNPENTNTIPSRILHDSTIQRFIPQRKA
jgi:hypothetical protein